MRLVDDGRHPSHYLAVSLGDEKLDVGVGVERMFGAVEQFLHRDAQGRHPMRDVAIQPVRQFHELLQRFRIVGRDYVNSSQVSRPL